MKTYYQCKLTEQNGTDTLTTYIEERGAKVGALVEIKEYCAFYRVEEVYTPGVPEDQLHSQQNMNRNWKKNTDI